MDIDTTNHNITKRIYSFIFNETYIYKDFPQREDSAQNNIPWPI